MFRVPLFTEVGRRSSWDLFRSLKDKDVDLRIPKQSVYALIGHRFRLYQKRSMCLKALFRGVVVVRIRKHTHKTRRSVTTHYRPWRSRRARVKRQLLGKWPRRMSHTCKFTAVACVCVFAGAK